MVKYVVQGRLRPQYPPKKHSLICYHCYEKVHSAPTGILSLREMHRSVRNGEALSLIERLGIPSTSYLEVKNLFEAQRKDTMIPPPSGRTDLQRCRPRSFAEREWKPEAPGT